MSFRTAAANFYDEVEMKKGSSSHSLLLTPVFHVEKLYNDDYFTDLIEFCISYKKLTKCRVVLTCMTPESPILASELRERSFSEDKYWDRISELSKNGIIGLHGHYVRSLEGETVVPMHSAFYDFDVVKEQILRELTALRQRGLVDDDLLIYSAGWWFINKNIRSCLADLGFKWDYSISVSSFNISPGLNTIGGSFNQGCMEESIDGHIMKSPIAVCSISKPNRPYHSIGKLNRTAKMYPVGEVNLSLYAHDFDLHLRSALKMVQRYVSLGIRFVEPTK